MSEFTDLIKWALSLPGTEADAELIKLKRQANLFEAYKAANKADQALKRLRAFRRKAGA